MNASPNFINAGENIVVQWGSTNATNCQASGSWGGAKGVSGTISMPDVQESKTFQLSCSNVSGSGAMGRSVVSVIQSRQIELSFTATPNQIEAGDSTKLIWEAKNAGGCVASGDWSGSKGPSGHFDTGVLRKDAVFQLTCSNSSYEETALVSIDVDRKRVKLRWAPPRKNIDGTYADDIAGYRIYWGKKADAYTGSVTIESPDVTEWEPDLPPGAYFFALSAYDHARNESEKSDPVRQVIR